MRLQFSCLRDLGPSVRGLLVSAISGGWVSSGPLTMPWSLLWSLVWVRPGLQFSCLRVFSSTAFAITAIRSASRGALVVSCWVCMLYHYGFRASNLASCVFDLARRGIALLPMTIVVTFGYIPLADW